MSAGGRSRAAALALLAGVVVVVGAALVVPAGLYWSKTGAIIDNARSKILRADQRADASTALDDSLQKWDSFVATSTSGFVLEQSDEAATQATENRIKAVFKTFGGNMSSVSAQADNGPRDGVRAIRISTKGRIPRANLGPFLTALESDPPFIIVTEFSADLSGDELKLSIAGSGFRLLEPGT